MRWRAKFFANSACVVTAFVSYFLADRNAKFQEFVCGLVYVPAYCIGGSGDSDGAARYLVFGYLSLFPRGGGLE